MKLVVVCPTRQRRFAVPEQFAGKLVRCAGCQGAIQLRCRHAGSSPPPRAPLEHDPFADETIPSPSLGGGLRMPAPAGKASLWHREML